MLDRLDDLPEIRPFPGGGLGLRLVCRAGVRLRDRDYRRRTECARDVQGHYAIPCRWNECRTTERNLSRGPDRIEETEGAVTTGGAARFPWCPTRLGSAAWFRRATRLSAGRAFSRANFAGKTQTTNRLTLSRQGKVVAMTGDSQLPYLLGNVSLLPFEILPAAAQQSWDAGSGVSITEKDENRGPPFGPFGPLGGQPSETVQSGQEKTHYAITNDDGTAVVVKKAFQLSTPATADQPAFEINGSGDWIFDRRTKLPQSLVFSQKLVIRTDSEAVTIPISIKYHQLTPQELAGVRAEEKRRQDELAKRQAEQAKDNPLAKVRPSNELTGKYLSGADVPASNRPIAADVKVPNGLIIAHKWKGGGWHGAVVLEELSDGQIKFQEIGWSRAVYTRTRSELQLAPPEVDQPNLKPAQLKALSSGSDGTNGGVAPTATVRTWTDAGRARTIQATYLGAAEGKVRLRLSDGREMNVPLTKFSKADVEYVEKMQAAKKPEDDPFTR